jgi:hypothetical protein
MFWGPFSGTALHLPAQNKASYPTREDYAVQENPIKQETKTGKRMDIPTR